MFFGFRFFFNYFLYIFFYFSLKRIPPRIQVRVFKCHYGQILDAHFFSYTIGLVLDILPNFYLLRTLELMFFGPFFREFTAAINFSCSKFWWRIGENDVIFSEIPHGLKL